MSEALLDVNALIAWEHRGSPHHAAFHAWVRRKKLSTLWTCAITELGFIRVSLHVFGYTLAEATEALLEMRKHTGGFVESAPPPQLATWASTAARTTDAYLVQLAKTNGIKLATFDTGIKDPMVEIIA